MMRVPAIALALLCLVTPTLASDQGAASNAAVQKVIQMLGDMLATAKQEKHEEEVKYADFDTFCAQETADLKEDITEQGEHRSAIDRD